MPAHALRRPAPQIKTLQCLHAVFLDILSTLPVQALQLVVVAVHSRALSLLYVDQLLEDVKRVSTLNSQLGLLVLFLGISIGTPPGPPPCSSA